MHLADVFVDRGFLLLMGLGALALVGWTGSSLPYWARVIAALPGAALVAGSLSGGGARTVVLVTTLAGSGAVAEWGQWEAVRSAGPAMLAVTSLGVYLSTPDTEHAVVVLGVALAVGLTGWPIRAAAVGGAGGAAFVGLVAWLAATDGFARPGAVVGASACVGAFTFAPVLRRLRVPLDRARARSRVSVALLITVTHGLVVFACSRIAGLQQSGLAAAVLVGCFVAAAICALTAILRN